MDSGPSLAEQARGVQDVCVVRQGVDEGMRLLVARLEGEVGLLMATRGEDLRGMSTRLGDLELAIAEKTSEFTGAGGFCKSLPVPVASQADDRRVAAGDDAADVQVTSRIARLEAEVSAVMQRQGSLDARMDRVADLVEGMHMRLAAEVSAVTRRQETDVVADVQVAFRDALEILSTPVDGISDMNNRLAEQLANVQVSTADLERNMRKWASRMDELAAVLADNVPRFHVGERKETDGVAALVVNPLHDLKPAWACEQAIKLSEEVYDAGGAMRLDQFASVSASVEHLNGDDGLCPEGFCVVASASCGQPVLIWRRDCRSNALARFDLESPGSVACDLSAPDVRQPDSGSWRCQAGILKAMTCTTS